MMLDALLRESPQARAPSPRPAFPTPTMLPAYFPADLREASSLLRLAAGEQLFAADTSPLACYRVVKGSMSLLRPVAVGGPLVVQHAGEGDWLVEPGPYDKRTTCTATAERPTIIRMVPIRAFRDGLRRDAEFANGWGRETALRARRLQLTVERLSLIRASDRILHYLAMEGADGGEVHLDFSLREWARQLGMTGETLSRVVADMETEGSVERIGRRGFRLLK